MTDEQGTDINASMVHTDDGLVAIEVPSACISAVEGNGRLCLVMEQDTLDAILDAEIAHRLHTLAGS